MLSPEGHIANVAYDFARYVRAAVNSGLTGGLEAKAAEVEDLALRVITEDFRGSA